MKLLLILLSSFSFQFLLSASVRSLEFSCNFPAIFNLGDSNSDTGGLSATLLPLGLPYGETFFKNPAGRFSDGRLIIDFVAESLGLPYISAYLNSLGTNFSHGANFATALSTIIPQNSTLPLGVYSPFSLDVQLQQFLQFKLRSQMVYKQGGEVFRHLMPKREYFSRALYMFDIGQNDLTALYFFKESPRRYLSDALSNFYAAVKSVYEEGGRAFWIHNTGPLGCLPYVLVSAPVERGGLDAMGCSTVLNGLAEEFNRMLNETVRRLRKDLPLAAFTLVDIYSVKYSLFTDAANNGFEHPLEACCGYGGGAYNYNVSARCGRMAVVNHKNVLLGKACRNPEERIIWDGVHYTEAANKWVFDKISSGAFSYPPTSLNRACHRII